METLSKSIVTAIIFLLLGTTRISADYNVSETSGYLITDTNFEIGYSEIRLQSFLTTYNSPLSDHASAFIYASTKHDLDWRFLPSITGVESTFGKAIPANSYNAYGWANGKYTFESWADSIDHVSEALKTKYIDRGATDVYMIGKIYAPPSPSWAYKVEGFMNKIDPIPLEFSL